MLALEIFLSGFSLALVLIIPMGPQTAFVLRQGLKGECVTQICAICVVSDVVLITGGVIGFATIEAALPRIEPFLIVGGAAFLAAYGARSLAKVIPRGGEIPMAVAVPDGPPLACGARLRGTGDPVRPAPQIVTIAVTCLLLTWLNPHILLDSVVVLGSVATRSALPGYFAAGAIAGSTLFYIALSYGARYLRPLFVSPHTWLVLDAAIGLLMFLVAGGLLFSLAR